MTSLEVRGYWTFGRVKWNNKIRHNCIIGGPQLARLCISPTIESTGGTGLGGRRIWGGFEEGGGWKGRVRDTLDPPLPVSVHPSFPFPLSIPRLRLVRPTPFVRPCAIPPRRQTFFPRKIPTYRGGSRPCMLCMCVPCKTFLLDSGFSPFDVLLLVCVCFYFIFCFCFALFVVCRVNFLKDAQV